MKRLFWFFIASIALHGALALIRHSPAARSEQEAAPVQLYFEAGEIETVQTTTPSSITEKPPRQIKRVSKSRLPDPQPVSATEGYSNRHRQPPEEVGERATPLQTDGEQPAVRVQTVEQVVARTAMANSRTEGDAAAVATSPPAVENSPALAEPANAVFSEQGIWMIQNPIYPERAKKEGWEGTVVLEVFIDSQGRPERVEINRSSGFAVLDQAAKEAVKHWRFRPAQWAGRQIASTGRVPIVFRLDVKN